MTKEELNRQRFLYPLQAVGIDNEMLAKRYSDDFFSIIPTKSRLMPYAEEVLSIWHPHIIYIFFQMALESCNPEDAFVRYRYLF